MLVRPRAGRLVAAAVAAVVLSMAGLAVVGLQAADASTPQRPRAAARLHWRGCGGGVQCARLRVPLDDQAPPGGPTIEVALERVRARDPDRRIGSLVVNPGGPGAPGASFAADIAPLLPGAVRDRFDVVGFDPRGTGGTVPIDCKKRLDGYYDLEFAPDDAEERSALVEGTRDLADACERRDGRLLPYVSTRRTARDLDRIRAALGDDRLTYLGYSYGTYLGALYADQFPQRVRALLLDGPIDPSLDGADTQVQQAVGFERALQLFLDDCTKRASCGFDHGGDAGAAYDRLRSEVGRQPLPARGAGKGRVLNGTTLDIGVTQLLYGGHDSWSQLADDLQTAADGDGSDLLVESDAYTGRYDNGTYSDVGEAFLAIGCLDGPDVGGPTGLALIEERAQREAPRLGRAIVNASMPCAYWPVPTEVGPVPHAVGAAPILVLGTSDDPATPLSWGRGLAAVLSSATLVTVQGEQHTAFASGNPCVERIGARYLVQLAVPRAGARC